MTAEMNIYVACFLACFDVLKWYISNEIIFHAIDNFSA